MPKIFVISGPSAVGKTTLAKMVANEFSDVENNVSYTTRHIREGEKDTIDYNFISQQKFMLMKQNNDFVEYINIYGNYYGTSKSYIEKKLSKGISLVVVVEFEGAAYIMKCFKDIAINMYILPPSIRDLKARFIKRGDKESDIENRISLVKKELQYAKNYMHYIVNEDLNKAYNVLRCIVKSYL